MVRPATILGAFDQAGYRATEPRRAVARLISEQAGHFSAEELLARARRGRIRVGRATIFRSLDILTELGYVERLDLPSGEHAFVACAPVHHHHVVCSSCGRSTDIADSGFGSALSDLAARSGYRIQSHRLEVFGLCPTCQADGAG
jgi:Fur family transcriptional regulator, ferric uptake regulator